ncbi:hypothetical protein PV10_03612 [Exophiala mesophila]|uniref:Zn(2)-C6 fungal-type domain-containing protein n=1 Tax=Exophiala mesophila TaxID=212818 RepID=A0A0D1X2T6_EXOME|nr:uncharacterized protein PV10_03612 [Exophiala mesophila]KIV96030.1 hypothetical protein PV10_03612 [Exophiala mesophila]
MMPLATIKIAKDPPGPRRTQFSSCDACRTSRVACDAIRAGYVAGNPEWKGSCSRCSRRKRNCTFEWIAKSRKSAVSSIVNARPFSHPVSPPTTESSGSSKSPEQVQKGNDFEPAARILTNVLSTHLDHSTRLPPFDSLLFAPPLKSDPIPLDGVVRSPYDIANAEWGPWLDQIFDTPFQAIFGWWLGRYCCPLVDDPSSIIVVPPRDLFSALDASMADECNTANRESVIKSPYQRQKQNDQIEHALTQAARAFASRWLPIVADGFTQQESLDEIIREFWRVSRKTMLTVINRVSYRSVLTLFIFGLTPIPLGISDEEESEGLTGQICVQAALQQVQRLRERQRNCQFSGAQVSPATDRMSNHPRATPLNEDYLKLESRAYWSALIFDTSASVSLNFRSSLTSGVHGFKTEPAWAVIKTFLTDSFHSQAESWRIRGDGTEVSTEKACHVLAAVAVCKLYVWKMIAVVKEAVREGDTEDKVLEAWSSLMEALDMFKGTIRPLLGDCLRRLSFMGQDDKLNWYEVALHYHLGILMLVDAVEAAERPDLLRQLEGDRIDAEHEAFELIKYGLENEYTLFEPDTGRFRHGPISRSFIAVDPYPNHAVASVRLLNKAISRDFNRGNIQYDEYASLASVLLEVLEQLPQSSKSVHAARQYLQRSVDEVNSLFESRGRYRI